MLEYQEQKEEILTFISKKSLSNLIYMQLTKLSTIPDCHELMIQLHDNIFNKKSTLNEHRIQKLCNKDSNDNRFIVLQKYVDEDEYNSYRTSLAIGLGNYLYKIDQTQISDNNAIILHTLFDTAKYSKIGETNWQGLYNKIYPTIKDGRKLTIEDIQDMLKMIPTTSITDAHFFLSLRRNLGNQYVCDESYSGFPPLILEIPDLA